MISLSVITFISFIILSLIYPPTQGTSQIFGSNHQNFIFETSQGKITNFHELEATLNRRNYNPVADLRTPDVIKLYGYPVESHRVLTEDGYILTMHRIPYSPNLVGENDIQRRIKGIKSRPIVYLQHGLFASSYEWLMNKPEKLLALKLSDAGYDVWFGNARGNAYSREHVNLTTKDRKFWEYSMHEMGKYDVPAEIDHILKTTNSSKLNYVGFSLGTTTFWIMLSLRPEYNEKINLMVALAPVVYINNMKGFPRLFLAPFEKIIKALLDFLFNGEFLPPILTRIYNFFGKKFCSNTFIAESFCANINFLYAGWDLPQTQINQLPLFYGHTPSPTSTRTLAHVSQFINTGRFSEYDFGMMENLKIYRNLQPPQYNLKNIKAPVALFWGPNDAVVDPIDVSRLATELPNIVYNTPVNYTFWNHFDYHLGRDVNEYVNMPVMRILSRYNNIPIPNV